MMSWFAILLVALLLRGNAPFSSRQMHAFERNEGTHFSLPEKAGPGTVYRVADHTNFEWDTMGILYWHKLYMEPHPADVYKEIETLDPAFFDADDTQGMALVFYLNGEIVHASHGGDSRIMINNPLHSYVRPYLELSVEEAVFVFVGSPWPEWVPHHLLEKFGMPSFSSHQMHAFEKSEGTHFFLPESASPGTVYRVADHTDFEWDRLMILSWNWRRDPLQADAPSLYKDIEAFDPAFFTTSGREGMALVFYQNEAIVCVGESGKSRVEIDNPLQSSYAHIREFSVEGAVFVFMGGERSAWVPQDFVEDFLYPSQLYFRPDP